MTEAVIQFLYRLHSPCAEADAAAQTMAPVFRAAQELGVIGRDPQRYEGLAFGNLSHRPAGAEGFWVTATQTADRRLLRPQDLVWIDSWQLEQQTVVAHGNLPPSSETLSHAAIHGARAGTALWVLHGHAPSIWQQAAARGWAVTDVAAANGTLALARALAALATPASGLIVMGGHRDGVIAYGDEADTVLQTLSAALETTSPLSTP